MLNVDHNFDGLVAVNRLWAQVGCHSFNFNFFKFRLLIFRRIVFLDFELQYGFFLVIIEKFVSLRFVTFCFATLKGEIIVLR